MDLTGWWNSATSADSRNAGGKPESGASRAPVRIVAGSVSGVASSELQASRNRRHAANRRTCGRSLAPKTLKVPLTVQMPPTGTRRVTT
jgi:hypothetical protein